MRCPKCSQKRKQDIYHSILSSAEWKNCPIKRNNWIRCHGSCANGEHCTLSLATLCHPTLAAYLDPSRHDSEFLAYAAHPAHTLDVIHMFLEGKLCLPIPMSPCATNNICERFEKIHFQAKMMYCAVRLEMRDDGGTLRATGTGFYFRFADGELCLVTNKHVLCAQDQLPVELLWKADVLPRARWRVRPLALNGTNLTPASGRASFLIVENMASQVRGIADMQVERFPNRYYTVELTGANAVWWHPSHATDLAAIRLTHTVLNVPTTMPIFTHLSEEDLLTFEKRPDADAFDPIMDVFMVGFPNGFVDDEFDLPLLRRGTTAYPLRQKYRGQAQGIIDVDNFNGSSGSPVFRQVPAAIDNTYTLTAPRYQFIGVNYSTLVYRTETRSMCHVSAPSQVETFADGIDDVPAPPQPALSTQIPSRTSIFVHCTEIRALHPKHTGAAAAAPGAASSAASAVPSNGNEQGTVVNLSRQGTVDFFHRFLRPKPRPVGHPARPVEYGWEISGFKLYFDVNHTPAAVIILQAANSVGLTPAEVDPSSKQPLTVRTKTLAMHLQWTLAAGSVFPGSLSACSVVLCKGAGKTFVEDTNAKSRTPVHRSLAGWNAGDQPARITARIRRDLRPWCTHDEFTKGAIGGDLIDAPTWATGNKLLLRVTRDEIKKSVTTARSLKPAAVAPALPTPVQTAIAAAAASSSSSGSVAASAAAIVDMYAEAEAVQPAATPQGQ